MPRGVDGNNPFALTEEEIKSLEPNYKKPKHKVNPENCILLALPVILKRSKHNFHGYIPL